ncbi:hypothetical protein CLAIMM_05826 isoform 2 [Cladophialophora immunda]|nr:hypothetical protein CLAIMM_05826 isoform 2 [Cladophialophora immunda]
MHRQQVHLEVRTARRGSKPAGINKTHLGDTDTSKKSVNRRRLLSSTPRPPMRPTQCSICLISQGRQLTCDGWQEHADASGQEDPVAASTTLSTKTTSAVPVAIVATLSPYHACPDLPLRASFRRHQVTHHIATPEATPDHRTTV